jgi:hypothetical protein
VKLCVGRGAALRLGDVSSFFDCALALALYSTACTFSRAIAGSSSRGISAWRLHSFGWGTRFARRLFSGAENNSWPPMTGENVMSKVGPYGARVGANGHVVSLTISVLLRE